MMKKTNAKRVLAAALAGMMALSLSACGEQGGGALQLFIKRLTVSKTPGLSRN